MLTRNTFYAIPKERLANLLYCPSSYEVNGDLILRFQRGARHGDILLSDYTLPVSLGPRPAPRPYPAIGTRAEVRARSRADYTAVVAFLDRAVKRFEI